jgi:hypothetical protein
LIDKFILIKLNHNIYAKTLASFSLILLLKKYKIGTTTKVKNVANVNPKIIAQPIGPQKATFSPPI